MPADVDNDGDLDLIGSDAILLNQQRQLSLALPPQTGRSFVFEFAAQPGFGTSTHLGVVAIGFDLLPSPIILPFGVFALDPANSAIVGAIMSIAGGTGAGSINVPPNPALAGLRLYAQGVDIDLPSAAVRFTNLVATTIEPR